jgi:Leucine-rich repeat (LRR) protein
MIPLVVPKRANIAGGLWTPKVMGEFEEGDPNKSDLYLSGLAEIKELNGSLKLFFSETRINIRKLTPPEGDKIDELINLETVSLAESMISAPESRSVSNKDPLADLFIPDMYLYFTRKVPKMRMVDVHQVGTRIPLNKYNPAGVFGKGGTIGTFEVSLNKVPDVLQYRGLVIIKVPSDKPVTEEPVIFGFIKFETMRAQKFVTATELHLTEINDILSKAIDQKALSTGDDSLRRKVTDRVKSISTYRKAVKRAWIFLNLRDDEEVSFDQALSLMTYLDIFLVHSQAKRIFEVVDVDGSHMLGQSEFTNFLIAYDILGQTMEIELLDIFDSLKMVPTNDTEAYGKAASYSGFDFSGFCEALHMLSVHIDEEELMKVFCDTSGVKHDQLDTGQIQLEPFKKAWARLTDVKREMLARGLKPEDGLLGGNRNKDRLLRYVSEAERRYLENIHRINEVVEKIKKDRREKKDKKRIQIEERRAALHREADRFTALRNQEKRIVLKKEQEERGKKRLEEKILRNKLLQKQAVNKQAKAEELMDLLKRKERLRTDEIRAAGWDRLDISSEGLREVPPDLYCDELAQMKLSYLVLFDASFNKFLHLPSPEHVSVHLQQRQRQLQLEQGKGKGEGGHNPNHSSFLYWLSSLREMKLTSNRLEAIPDELYALKNLEILEAGSNRLVTLPPSFCELIKLQRLDLSSNHLTSLPTEFGSCVSLRYLCLHSNALPTLPPSLGRCMRLEFIDASNNALRELPEELQFLASLTHLDLHHNALHSLPTALGALSALSFLDLSVNYLTFLPASFSTLTALRYCDLTSNEIVSSSNRLNHCTSLQSLSLQKNQLSQLYPDLGFCTSLERLDLSNNQLTHLPQEVGLLVSLIELKLGYNRMEYIPPELGACGSLHRVELHHNAIRGHLPDTLGLMSSLRFLDLSFNAIDLLPRSVIGLVELQELSLESNCLVSLPDTLTTLSHLRTLNLSKNKFLRFPIHLRTMTRSLRELDLSNNAISLLPRTICDMKMLSTLHLDQNSLRSLPVEFVELLETVPSISLGGNPWDDLPPRWGKLWSTDRVRDCPNGNSVSEAIDFLYGMRAFLNTAEVVWQELGALHYVNKLSLGDFLQELRERLPKTWHDGLTKHAEFVYFKVLSIFPPLSDSLQCKEYGVFPCWYETDEERKAYVSKRQLLDSKLRQEKVERTRADQVLRGELRAERYDPTTVRRTVANRGLQTERAYDSEVRYNQEMLRLEQRVRESSVRHERKVSKQEEVSREKMREETRRLNFILSENRKHNADKYSAQGDSLAPFYRQKQEG